MQVIAGYDARDPYSASVDVPNYVNGLDDGDLKGTRIGVPKDYFWDYLDDEVEAAVRRAVALLGEMGYAIVEVAIPSMDEVNNIHTMLSESETAAYYQPLMEQFTKETPDILFQRIEKGSKVMATEYIRARAVRSRLKEEIDAAFQSADVLITPTSILPAPALGQFEFDHKGRSWEIGDLASRLSRPFNTTGHPAISICCGFTKGGLPIGLQIAGPNFAEGLLLKVADGYERAAKPVTRWPL